MTFQNRAGVLMMLGLAFTAASQAATFVVTKVEDDNGACTPDDCALREAVMAANNLAGGDRIEIPAGIYRLTIQGPDPVASATPESGDLDILDDLDLVGDPIGPTIIVADNTDRVVEILFTSVTFTGIELTRGRDLLSFGGCVRILRGRVTFTDSAVTDCFCDDVGGGIGAFDSTVTLFNSTVSGNLSDRSGGGILQAGNASELIVVNSTISGNRAEALGGGIFIDSGRFQVRSSTIANNEAAFADAIFLGIGNIKIQNSILEGKCTGVAPDSLGGNLAGPDVDVNCLSLSTTPTDVIASDLGLAPLANYGGLTKTHGLLLGSPAIDSPRRRSLESS